MQSSNPSKLATLSFLESAKPKQVNSNQETRLAERLRKTRGDNYRGSRFVDTLGLRLLCLK